MPGLVPPQRAPKKEPDPLLQFNVYYLSGGFIFLVVGWTLAIIILIIEQVVKVMQMRCCCVSFKGGDFS